MFHGAQWRNGFKCRPWEALNSPEKHAIESASTYMLTIMGTLLPLAIILISRRLTPGFGTPAAPMPDAPQGSTSDKSLGKDEPKVAA